MLGPFLWKESQRSSSNDGQYLCFSDRVLRRGVAPDVVLGADVQAAALGRLSSVFLVLTGEQLLHLAAVLQVGSPVRTANVSS